MHDAMGECVRLARSGSRQNEEGTIVIGLGRADAMLHGEPLFPIELSCRTMICSRDSSIPKLNVKRVATGIPGNSYTRNMQVVSHHSHPTVVSLYDVTLHYAASLQWPKAPTMLKAEEWVALRQNEATYENYTSVARPAPAAGVGSGGFPTRLDRRSDHFLCGTGTSERVHYQLWQSGEFHRPSPRIPGAPGAGTLHLMQLSDASRQIKRPAVWHDDASGNRGLERCGTSFR
jgi:hypothetical protein